MDNIKNNISKNLRAIASAFSKLNSTTLVLAIIGSIFIGILTINRILANKETLKRIKEEHVILDLDKSVPHSNKEESKDAEKTVAVVTKNPKGSSSKGMPLKEEFISSLVDASSVNIKGENYQVFSSDTDEGRQILKNEMSSFLDTELYIKNRELQNICVSQKVLYQSNSTEGNKLTLCRKHPDMKKDRFVRVTSLLRNKKICKAAAISLTKLASKFIFTIPDKEVRYLKLCKEFTDAKDALYSGEWT
ncbi:MAG: hypothetical protein KAH32_01965, partial [Chlamydiia bacterium]|nr:hypothetical protein [Chlamydiia bacterium]